MGRQSCSWLFPDIKRPLNPGSSRNCQHAFHLSGLSFLKCQVSVAISHSHACHLPYGEDNGMSIGTSTSQGFVKGRRRRVDGGNQRWMGKVQFSDFQKQICSPFLVPHPLKHSKIGENQTKLKAREERAKLGPRCGAVGLQTGDPEPQVYLQDSQQISQTLSIRTLKEGGPGTHKIREWGREEQYLQTTVQKALE